MAEVFDTYYVCDRCGTAMGSERDPKNYICDGHNHYFYDMCPKCIDKWNEYNKIMKGLCDEMEKTTKEYGFGKYMFEKRDGDEQRSNN